MPPGRPKKNSRLAIPEGEYQISDGETLDGVDYLDFMFEMERIRSDPIYFIEDILGFPGPAEDGSPRSMWPKQKEIIQEFYGHKYDPSLLPIKKLSLTLGQRCLRGDTGILTWEYGTITIEDLYNRFHLGEMIHVKNPIGWVNVGMVFYTGFKSQCKMLLEDGVTIYCSKDHKFKINDIWVPLSEINSGDSITCYNSYNGEFYESTVRGWDKEEFTCEMYDLYVPSGNCYIANGILVHNSSKTTLTATIMAYELVEVISWASPAKHFGLMTGKSGKGSTIALTCLCPSMKQAKDGVFASMRALIEGNPWFELNFPDLVFDTYQIEEPRKNVLAQVMAAKATTLAGYTNKCFIADEYDYFPDSDTQIDSEAVFTKLANSTETFKRDGKIIVLSSLKSQNGRQMALHNQFKKQEGNRLARAYMYKTWEFNPTVTQEYLLETCEGDRARFYRDFANEPQMSSGLQFPEGIKLDKTILNVLDANYETLQKEIKAIPRVMSIDPAYKNDSFGISVGYKHINPATEVGTVIIDGVKRFEKMGDTDATVLPSDIKNFIIHACMNLNVYAFLYDVHMYPEILEAVERDLGLEIVKHIVAKEDYDRWRELQEGLSNTKLNVVYDDNLETECNALFIKIMTGGKAKVDHPWNGCFTGDTKVKLLDGQYVPIESLTNMDHVWVCSCNDEGKLRSGRAKARLTKYVTELLEVTLSNGNIITCTPDHPFMLKHGDYKQVKDLARSDKLMPVSGLDIIVVSKKEITLDNPVPVYDLEVDKWSNFALMAGIYVHNSKDSADTVANCIWYLESDDSVDYSGMTTIGCAATFDSYSGLDVYCNADDDYVDFYA